MDNADAARIAGKISSTDPDHTNENGARWWADRNTRVHTKLKELGVHVWLAIDAQSQPERLITNKSQIIYNSTSLEAISCRLDILNLYPDLVGE